MSSYLFIAYNGEGTRIGGSRKAENEKAVQNELDALGLSDARIYKSETEFTSRLYGLVKPKELAIFCRQMSVMFFSHISLMEGVLLLSEQTDNKHLKQALLEVHGFMDKGVTFAEATCMYVHIFGTYLVNMITVGETSGTLDDVFNRMGAYFEKEDKIRRKIRSAIAYPAVLSALMAAIVIFLILKILPMFSDLLVSMGSEASSITAVILSVSLFITRYIWIILGVIAAIAIALVLFFRSDGGKRWLDKVKMTFPISRFVFTRLVTARFARSLAILLKSGVQLLNAMDEVQLLIDNSYLEDKFKTAMLDVKEGKELSESLAKVGVFPPLFLKMVIIGQSTGRLDEMLDKSAGIFDDEVDEATDRLTLMIEPILIIILSIIVGFILVSVMLPMISIMNAIG